MTHLANFCLFCKKNLSSVPWDKCARWFFYPIKFCQDLPINIGAVVLPQSSTNFWSGVKSDNFFQFKNHDLKEKRFDFYAAINRWRWKILHDDQYSGYSEKNYHGVQFYVQAESPSLSSAQFLHRCGWHSVVNNFFLLFRAPTIDKFCRYFWTWSKTNFASALGKQNRKIL